MAQASVSHPMPKCGRYDGVRVEGELQGSCAVRVRCSDAGCAVILSIITA